MSRLELAPVLAQMERGNADVIRRRVCNGCGQLLPKKENAMASTFFALLCSEKISAVMTDEEFGTMLEAVFSDGVRDVRWLGRYCDMLLRSVNLAKGKNQDDQRAARYDKHLQTVLVPEFKKKTGNPKEAPEAQALWDDLVDIYKIAAALYAGYTGGGFTLQVTLPVLKALEKTLRDNRVSAELPAGLLQKQINSIDPYRRDEREYAVVLSWFLTEMICDQDGIESQEA